MKWATGILGIIGALGALYLGYQWYSDLSDLGTLGAAVGELNPGLKTATYALLACGLIGLILSIMVLMSKGNKMVTAIVFILAGIAPMIFETTALFGVPMVLAGLFAFGIKNQNQATVPKAPTTTPSPTPNS